MDKMDLFYQELIGIFDLKMWSRHLEALEKIGEAFLRFVGKEKDEFGDLTDEELISHFRNESGDFDPVSAMITSHLLKQMADIAFPEGHLEKADRLFHQSFLLFMEVYRADPEFDFTRHVVILHELENRVPVTLITDEYEKFIDAIYEKSES